MHSNYRVIQQETNCAASSEGHHEVSAAARVSLRWGGVQPTAGVSPTLTFKSAVWNIPPSRDLSFNNVRGRGWRDKTEWSTAEHNECQSMRSPYIALHLCLFSDATPLVKFEVNVQHFWIVISCHLSFLHVRFSLKENWLFFTISENAISTLQTYLLYNICINKRNTLTRNRRVVSLIVNAYGFWTSHAK